MTDDMLEASLEACNDSPLTTRGALSRTLGLDPNQSEVQAELRAQEYGEQPTYLQRGRDRGRLVILDCLSLIVLLGLGVALAWVLAGPVLL